MMKSATIYTQLKHLPVLAACLLLASNPVLASHPHHVHGSDSPAGVMGDHLMAEDQWMLSYRFMHMDMAGNRTGTNRVATPLPGFMVSPTRMNMDMHMLGAMAGINDELTIMFMLPVLSIDMDHVVNMNGVTFNTAASGIGDLTISTNWQINNSGTLLNTGLSIPTGSIDETDDIPASAGVPVQLPYPMQLGSGTFDLILGLTQSGQLENMSWGAQGSLTMRSGENDNGYTLGNIVKATAWLSKPLTETMQASIRLNALNRGNIDGADTTLAAAPTVPTKNTELRGGTRLDAAIGLNLVFGNNLLGLEIGVPVYQDLDGPQLETDTVMTLGWQASF